MGLPLGGARRRIVAAALAFWTVLWLVVGALTGVQIRNLTQVSDSLAKSGRALGTAGTALEALGRLPVVGERPRRLGREVRATAEEVRGAAASSRETVRWVSVLVGVALVVIPVVPVLGVYVVLRVSDRRQRRAVARALEQSPPDPRLEEFLAHRALQHLDYEVLRRVSQDPWADLRNGAYRRLANAELTRLGLARRRSMGEAQERGKDRRPPPVSP